MAIAHLHRPLLDALIPRMSGWKFVARERHFVKRPTEGIVWIMHLTFINHVEDFDAVVDVAIDFVQGKKIVAVIGAPLGNIAGVGQTRFRTTGLQDIPKVVEGILEEFQRVGIPFLEKYSDAAKVLAIVKEGGREAGLISPYESLRPQKIAALEEMLGGAKPLDGPVGG